MKKDMSQQPHTVNAPVGYSDIRAAIQRSRYKWNMLDAIPV